MNEKVDISKITDKLYLGSLEGANDLNYLKQENINNVISILEEHLPQYEAEDKINHKIIKIEDSKYTNIIQYFKECIE